MYISYTHFRKINRIETIEIYNSQTSLNPLSIKSNDNTYHLV